MPARSTALRLLALALLALAVQLARASAAEALPARGHVFQSSFEGSGEHAFGAVAGLAVSEASGEVFVSDPSHERVERFKPDGHGGYEFSGELRVFDPGALAVDNSSTSASKGDLYVAGTEEKAGEPLERDYISKFSPTGEKIYKKSIFKGPEESEAEFEDISGIAVDSSGKVFVYWEEEGYISGLSEEEKNKLIPSLTKEEVLEQPLLEEPCDARPGFALGPNDDAFYVAHEREVALEEACLEEESRPRVVSKLNGAGQAIARDLDPENSTGVATDPEGNVYVDNVSSVAEFAADGRFSQRFGEGHLEGAGALASDAGEGELLAAEQGKIVIFAPEAAGAPPSIDEVFTQALSPSAERVEAQIDAHGSDTHYYVQYGIGDCKSEPSACSDVPLPPGADLGAAFGDRSAIVALEGLSPNTTYHYRVLAENIDGKAESEQSTETFFTTLPSASATLADHRAWEQVSPTNKHGAAIEAISREGAAIQAAAEGEAIAWSATAPVTEETQGNRRPEPEQVISRRGESEWTSQDISTPHNQGEGINTGEQVEYRLFSPDLSLAIVQPQVPSEPLESPPLSPETTEKDIYERGQSGEFKALVSAAEDTAGSHYGGKLEFQGASPELGHVVFESQVPLLSGQSEGGLYEFSQGQGLKLISTLPGTGTPAPEPSLGDQDLNARGAVSADGAKVFWTQGSEDEGPLYMSDTQSGQTIQLDAAQGPGTSDPTSAEREAGLAEVHFQAASGDGSRVFFTDTWPLTSDSTLEPDEEKGGEGRIADLYEYNTDSGVLSDLTVDRRAGESAEVLGTIPGISSDGSYVYFVANGVLAPGASPGDCPGSQEVTPAPGAACNLYVSGPDPENPAQRQTRLIARLSYEDAGDWAQRHSAGNKAGVLGDLTARVSANGRYLAFMSNQQLTGYDNADQNPAAAGARDQEVFLYDAAEGRLSCASCDPSGQAPRGVYDTERSGEGLGLLVDRPETWAGEWLSGSIPGFTFVGLEQANYQSRYLSDQGRLFFDSADALVPVSQGLRSETVQGSETQVGVENVYEYEPAGLGSCSQASGCVSLVSSGTSSHESAFLDASEGGQDAFFMTAAPLVASDTDSAFDVYDARICNTSESKPCLPEKPPSQVACAGEECRPPAPSEQSYPTAPTITSSGPGNIASNQSSPGPSPSTTTKPKPLSRAQKLARALKSCRKQRHRKKRQACERRARKAFGPKHKAKTKTAKKPKKSTSHRSRS
jgi:hypothetical protein